MAALPSGDQVSRGNLTDVSSDGRAIAVHVHDRTLRAQLAAAIHGPSGLRTSDRLWWCDSPGDLYTTVAERGAIAAITDWDDTSSGPVEDVIRRLRREFPTVPVLAYVSLTPAGARALLLAGRIGVSDAILAGYDDLGQALHGVLASAADNAMADYALVRLADLVPVEVFRILEYVFRHARAGPGVTDIANSLGQHRKTLADHCRRAHVPPPGELASWGRLAMAVARLADRGRTTDQVAARFRYRTGSALASMLKRYTGLTLSEARRRGPTAVLDLLTTRLRNSTSNYGSLSFRRSPVSLQRASSSDRLNTDKPGGCAG